MDVAPYAVVVPLIAAGLLTGLATRLNRAVAEVVALGAAVAVVTLCAVLLVRVASGTGVFWVGGRGSRGGPGGGGVVPLSRVRRLGSAGRPGDRRVVHCRRVRRRARDPVCRADGRRAGPHVALPGYRRPALPDFDAPLPGGDGGVLPLRRPLQHVRVLRVDER